MTHVLTTVEDSDDEIPMLFEDSHRHQITEDYEILQELGVGKFSVVRMAQHKRSKEKVAIKQIDRKVCPAELLVKEVNIMAKLKGCSGVIHLIEVYEEPDKPYTHLVMELVTGGELFDYIVKSSSYSEKSASDYIRQLCQSVEYLHGKNIVHRDLKPENMLFEDTTAQVLKLCDFGLADVLKDDFDFLTLSVGTKSYMAPEVSSGMGYGKPVDMYSIGVILYILLCGYLPIDPENGIYVLEFPPSEWSGIGFEVKLLIKKLLDDSPAARPTATQVLKHPWIRGTNTSTKPLVGTLRNLKSWNQVGGRAITKPRGQVMNLFDNPPSATSSESSPTDTNAAASPKAKRAASPKPKVTKAKKAALPKLIDGVLTPASPVPFSLEPAEPKPASPSKAIKPKTNPKEGTKRAKSPSPRPDLQLTVPTPTATSSNSANDSSSSSSRSTADTTDAKPTATKSKRKTDRPTRDAPRSPARATASKSPSTASVKASDATLSPKTAVALESQSGASTPASGPSTPSKSSNTSKSERSTTANGESGATKPVSDRTKKFLQAQEDRDAAKKADTDEKKRRRRSVGGAAAKRSRVENDEQIDARTDGVEKPEKPEKVKDKKEKNGESKERKDGSGDKREKDAISADASVASGTVSKSSKASNVTAGAKGEAASPETMASRAAKRKSMREIAVDPMDLTALIESALSDDEDAKARRRSSSVASITPVQKPRRPKNRDSGLIVVSTGLSTTDDVSTSPKSSRKSGRDRSATSHDAGVGDFSSFGSDSATAPANGSNGSKLKIVTASRHTKAGTDQMGAMDTVEEYYPRRSASKSSGLSAKKANRMSMGSPTQSPKRSRPTTPTVAENGTSTSPVISRSSSRRAASPKVPRASGPKEVLPRKTSPKQKRNDDSDSESYGTGQSSPGTPIDDNFKVLLDPQSSDATEELPVQKTKKASPMRQISSLSSDSE